MKIRQLEYLVTIADTGSFAKAAATLNVSQPTLSQQIRTLEAYFGVPLLERSSNGAWPTPPGREIVERARTILRDMGELAHVARRAGSRISGTIRLGTTPTLGPYLLSPVIAELHQVLPELRIHVREGIPNHLASDLSKGQIDLYLGPLPIQDTLFHIEPLFRESLHLVVAKDHPLARQDRVTASQLVDLAVLSIDERHHYHRQVSRIVEKFGMRLAADYEGTSLDSLHQMAASGLGAAILPSLYLASDVGGLSGLAIVKVAGWDAYRSIALAWRRSTTLSEQFVAMGTQIERAARAMTEGNIHAPGPMVDHPGSANPVPVSTPIA
ncbi:LysR family transcriptional regulator [Sphingomonas sp. 37zxx]|uniref:LysR family transcriptional regulator n=1 Tax=Sphingomonas sp. 37zxx TaxID=1550073 RepID=UPI0009E00C77|nr:hydrogen peroxide-inducible genes activator [Sphingomonas sp. 37zxx]